jgi:hypothetical protein
MKNEQADRKNNLLKIAVKTLVAVTAISGLSHAVAQDLILEEVLTS